METQQLLFVLYLILLSIYLAGIAIGIVIFVGNERVRQATLALRDVEREQALAELALRREQARREIKFESQEAILKAMTQIILDVTGERQDLSEINTPGGQTLALVALALSGNEFILTPSAEAYLAGNPPKKDKAKEIYPVSALVSNLFVIQELEAMGEFFNLGALPRTEQWQLITFASSRAEAIRARRKHSLLGIFSSS